MNEFTQIQISVLNELFENFNINKIDYCILRNYEKIPEDIGNDIDFLISKKNCKNAKIIILNTFKKYDFILIKYKQRFGHIGLIFIHKDLKEILCIDLLTNSSKQWYQYADVEYILKNKLKYKNFYVPTKGSELYTVVLKDLLTYNLFREKNHDLLKSLNSTIKKDFIDTGLKYLDITILENIYSSLENLKSIPPKKEIFNNLKQNSNFSDLIKYTYYRAKEIFINLIFNKLYFISIIGPDGVGKSTVTSNLKKDLSAKNLFKNILDIHHRFEYLPNISILLKRNKKVIEKKVEENNEIQRTNPNSKHSAIRTLIYVIYYSIDFILGYFKVLKYKANGDLIIADRYYYDFYLQKHYDRLPSYIKRFFYLFIPKPNLIFFLSANAEDIYKRKYELTLEETQEQNKRCLEIIKKFEGNVIDANKDALEVNEQIKNIIYKRMINE